MRPRLRDYTFTKSRKVVRYREGERERESAREKEKGTCSTQGKDKRIGIQVAIQEETQIDRYR